MENMGKRHEKGMKSMENRCKTMEKRDLSPASIQLEGRQVGPHLVRIQLPAEVGPFDVAYRMARTPP